MCEFCSLGPSSNALDRDADHSDFAGFFSSAAIEEALKQANAIRSLSSGDDDSSKGSDEEEDDGT